MSTPTELSERTLDHLNEYIKFADQKASILLSGQLAFLGLFANLLMQNWSGTPGHFKVLALLTVACALIAAVLAGWVIYPQTSNDGKNLLFWETIVDKSEDEYNEKIHSLSDTDVLNELIEENHQLAEVASSKYIRLKYSLIATALMLPFATLAVIVLLSLS